MCSGVVKRQVLEVDVSVFVIGINEFGVLEVLVFVTLADGTIVPANLLINVVMVSWYIYTQYKIIQAWNTKRPENCATVFFYTYVCTLQKCA